MRFVVSSVLPLAGRWRRRWRGRRRRRGVPLFSPRGERRRWCGRWRRRSRGRRLRRCSFQCVHNEPRQHRWSVAWHDHRNVLYVGAAPRSDHRIVGYRVVVQEALNAADGGVQAVLVLAAGPSAPQGRMAHRKGGAQGFAQGNGSEVRTACHGRSLV